jgi:hypothetical protein
MRDDPSMNAPMVEWETVEVIDGIADVLAYLYSSGRRIGLATSANLSDEAQICGALHVASWINTSPKSIASRTRDSPKAKPFIAIFWMIYNPGSRCADGR